MVIVLSNTNQSTGNLLSRGRVTLKEARQYILEGALKPLDKPTTLKEHEKWLRKAIRARDPIQYLVEIIRIFDFLKADGEKLLRERGLNLQLQSAINGLAYGRQDAVVRLKKLLGVDEC